MTNCPLCTIPDRETPLYEDKLVYLIPTKNMKGHVHRVMCVIRRHTSEPNFEEVTRAYGVIIQYMNNVVNGKQWFLVADTFATIKDHKHFIGCDKKGTSEELKLLEKTPKVEFPFTRVVNKYPLIKHLLKLKKRKILVGIPAFNEEKTIDKVISCASKYGNVVVVNDGSTDQTEDISSKGATCISFDENYGYGHAIKTLFNHALEYNYNVLITLDADGQHNPDEIPMFLKEIESGADVVICNRFKSPQNIPSYRKFGIQAISLIEGFDDAQCGFRAYNKKAIECIMPKEKSMGVSLEILRQARQNNLKIAEVACTVHYNKTTTHSQHPLTHGGKLLETILWSRVWDNPFRYLGFLGVICFFTGLVSTLQLMNIYIQHRVFVFSWVVLAFGGLFSGALLLMSASIIYLFRRGLEEMK